MSIKGKLPDPPSWSIFDGFDLQPRARSWSQLDEFVSRGRKFAEQRCRAFPELLVQWDKHLEYLDGDPCKTDWGHFRPLQADREEDWSDWLQHFLSTSTTGRFAQQMFGRSGFANVVDWAQPLVKREDATENRRADLVIRWRNGDRSHLEVKVGDLSLSKTVDTAAKLELKYPGKWTHYLLLPEEDAEHWDDAAAPDGVTISVMTWDTVALALRRALREGKERRGWSAWAHGFCGIIEQKLLSHPVGDAGVTGLSMMERRLRQIALMEKGLEDV